MYVLLVVGVWGFFYVYFTINMYVLSPPQKIFPWMSLLLNMYVVIQNCLGTHEELKPLKNYIKNKQFPRGKGSNLPMEYIKFSCSVQHTFINKILINQALGTCNCLRIKAAVKVKRKEIL